MELPTLILLVDDTTQLIPTSSRKTWTHVLRSQLTMLCSSLSVSMLLPHLLIDGAAKVGRTSLPNGTHVAVKLKVTWHPFLESQGGYSNTNNQRPLA